MMERLRLKGQLGRRMADDIYRYRARASSADLLESAVQRFVERSPRRIGFSLSGVSIEAGQVSTTNCASQEIVARLHAERRRKGDES